MSHSQLEYGTPAFFDALAWRLRPLLGDVNNTLGTEWKQWFLQCFTETDFDVVARARAGRPPAGVVLCIPDEAQPLARETDPAMAHDSEAHCVAMLLDHCKRTNCFPDRITREPPALTFWRDTQTLATIAPVPPSPALSPFTRKRAQTLLGGLNKRGRTDIELFRRIIRWPGLAHLKPDPYTRVYSLHWPSPSEWLISARHFWGSEDSQCTMAQAQALAAAAFGFANWHQLCGLLPAGSADADWWALAGPFQVASSGNLASPLRVYADPLAAFIDFAGRGAGSGSQANPYTFQMFGHWVNGAKMQLRIDREAERYKYDHVEFSPVARYETDPERVSGLQRWLSAKDYAALLRCFALDPEDDVPANRAFHTVQTGNLRCDGVVKLDGPMVIVGSYGVHVGEGGLCKFSARDAAIFSRDGCNSKPRAGWWLVSRDRERKADLTSLSDAQAHHLSEEFGLPILDDRNGEKYWDFYEDMATRQFYSSPAWTRLRQWCRAHPGLAAEAGTRSHCLPDWYRKATLTNFANLDTHPGLKRCRDEDLPGP